MKKLLEKIKTEIQPSKREIKTEREIAKEVMQKIKSISREQEEKKLQPLLVGSLAKGTDIKGDKDIDIFILFSEKTPREELEETGLRIGEKVFEQLKAEYEIDYAEHPYVVGKHQNYLVDIVPCYDTEKVKSAVDRTPHHTQYVLRKLEKHPELKNEVLLLKQFMKGIGVYGAESKVQGFSGYLVELLIINYGSFKKTLEEAAEKWRLNWVIDPEENWKNHLTVKSMFQDDELIIIDPVDPYRNAASAVSRQRISEFMVNAREFLKNPDREFFFPSRKQPPSVKQIEKKMKERGSRFLGLSFKHQDLNTNSIYSQLRKSLKSAEKQLELQGFRIMKTSYWTDEKNQSLLLLELSVFELPDVEKKMGPPVDRSIKNQEKFVEKYRETLPYLEDGRWYADAGRKYTKASEVLEELAASREGFGKRFREEKTEVEVLGKEKLLENKDENYLLFLGRFLRLLE